MGGLDTEIVFKGRSNLLKATILPGGVDAVGTDTGDGDPQVTRKGGHANNTLGGVEGKQDDHIGAEDAVPGAGIGTEEQNIKLIGRQGQQPNGRLRTLWEGRW